MLRSRKIGVLLAIAVTFAPPALGQEGRTEIERGRDQVRRVYPRELPRNIEKKLRQVFGFSTEEERREEEGRRAFRRELSRAPTPSETFDRATEAPPGSGSSPYIIENQDFIGRYRFLDSSEQELFQGDNFKLMAKKLNGEFYFEPLVIELREFSNDKAMALATSLRIQERQIDPSVSVEILPGRTPDTQRMRCTRSLERIRGIRLDPIPAPKEFPGYFAGKPTFSVRIRERVRSFPIGIIAASRELYFDLCYTLRSLLPAAEFDESQSVKEAIRHARKKVESKYGDLSREQLRIYVLRQFSWTEITRSFREEPTVWM